MMPLEFPVFSSENLLRFVMIKIKWIYAKLSPIMTSPPPFWIPVARRNGNTLINHYEKKLDLICAYSIYMKYFISRYSPCWLADCVKLAREIYFWSEQKHMLQSVYTSQYTVRASKSWRHRTICHMHMQGIWFPFLRTGTGLYPESSWTLVYAGGWVATYRGAGHRPCPLSPLSSFLTLCLMYWAPKPNVLAEAVKSRMYRRDYIQIMNW